jgi:hypothetical protein
MKTIANFPAFEVVDLELPVIDMSREMLEGGFRFCVSKETLHHGNLYPEVAPSCVAYYAEKYNEDPAPRIAKAKSLGEELYWVNNCGASIVSHDRPQYTLYLLKPGQIVTMNGQRLGFYMVREGYYGLVEI